MHRKLTITSLKRTLTKSLIIALVSVLALSVISTPQTVYAEDEYAAKIDVLKKQIGVYESEAKKLSKQSDSLAGAVAKLQKEQDIYQGQINISQAKQDQLVGQIKDTETKIARNQTALGETIASLYVNSKVSPVEMLASSKSIGDYLDQQEYRTTISGQVEVSIKEIKSLKSDLEKKKTEVDKVIENQKAQKSLLASKQQEQSSLLAQTRGNEAAYRGLVKSLEQQKEEAEAALAKSLANNSYTANAVSEGRVNAGDVVGAVGNSGLSSGPHLHLEVRKNGKVTDPSPYIEVQPLASGYISQSFGNADPIYVSGHHPGVDYAAPQGTPIRAIKGGQMYRGCSIDLFNTTAYGYVGVVEHNDGTVALYAHMSGGPAKCTASTY